MSNYSNYTYQVCRSIYELIGLGKEPKTMEQLTESNYLKDYDKSTIRNAVDILLKNKLLNTQYDNTIERYIAV